MKVTDYASLEKSGNGQDSESDNELMSGIWGKGLVRASEGDVDEDSDATTPQKGAKRQTKGSSSKAEKSEGEPEDGADKDKSVKKKRATKASASSSEPGTPMPPPKVP